MKPKFATQKQIEENLGDCDEKIKSGLFALVSNIILFKDAKADGFHFRVNMSRTSSFHTLDDWLKEKLKHFYIDYFYKRQDELWQNEAIERLSAVKNASSMLVCGEDLGFVPDCVPPTMMELGILGLKIQRMPKEQGREFGFTDQYPYLTVCSTSTHDTSTIRGWWQEDPEKIQHYYNDILRHDGPAPKECIPAIAEEIITQHFNSPSMWVIIPIQDLLAMDKGIRTPGNPKKERINDPSQSHLYWKYRLHINLEGLKKQMKFNGKILDMLTAAGRT